MYSKEKLESVMNSQSKQDLETRLNELQSQMSVMYNDYFSNVKPKIANTELTISEIRSILSIEDLTYGEKNILIHFITFAKEGITDVYISAAADDVNIKRSIYAKMVRKMCDKGYLRGTHKKGIYQLNKVY
jgi:DNA-binding MarR family transcriptional regulator